MKDFKSCVIAVVNGLPFEFRNPVIAAANVCNGTLQSFSSELESQVWEYPDLPVQEIINQISAQ